ncbi:hypothetical protein GCM10022261_26910 [Brevibacterium daeguense]|uniref:DUF4307 domain-containing protein n=1 Tax=Brevibacterium daeguense TaxID=909936 RepID=A0ABP8EMI8_9MICO|nr:DUF4307 domain-containing protein [Brevibacterium daeguense]
MTTAQASLSDRYGSARRRKPPESRRRRQILAAVIGILAMSALAAWYALAPSRTPVNPTTVSYEIVDSTLTVTQMSVVPDSQRAIRCAVQATNENEAVVGFREVTIAPDPAADESQPSHLRVEISTTQLAASGHVESCWFLG